MTFYTEDEYSRAYTELLEILKYIPDSSIEKIPKENIEMYELNKDTNYEYHYDNNLTFEEQNISHLTKILIANLYIDYWATNEERTIIKEHDSKELEALEIEKNRKYNTDDIFANRKRKLEEKAQNIENTSMIVVENTNIFKKIMKKIKKLLHLT